MDSYLSHIHCPQAFVHSLMQCTSAALQLQDQTNLPVIAVSSSDLSGARPGLHGRIRSGCRAAAPGSQSLSSLRAERGLFSRFR